MNQEEGILLVVILNLKIQGLLYVTIQDKQMKEIKAQYLKTLRNKRYENR